MKWINDCPDLQICLNNCDRHLPRYGTPSRRSTCTMLSGPCDEDVLLAIKHTVYASEVKMKIFDVLTATAWWW